MPYDHVGHADVVRFADDRVNLKREDVAFYREQVNRLRDRLEQYLKENPNFALRKILLSGSLAKGTALKSLDDIDVALYVSIVDAPADMRQLIPWLGPKLRQAFPNFKPEQVVENIFTLTVSFADSGLRVDVVPILYEDDPNWKGHLVSKETGDRVLTSIPMHLDFIRRRKTTNDTHYVQIVRLMKYWVQNEKTKNPDFRFKSFMIELLVAYLADRGLPLDDYPEALAQIFAFIVKDAFQTPIVFGDHYDTRLCVGCLDPMQIWDPVNPENNTASRYTEKQKATIIEAALDAGDAIDSALRTPTKSEALRYWRKIFGPTFDV